MKPFGQMPGGELLAFVRDELLNEAARKRSYIEQSKTVPGMARPTQQDLLRLKAIEAAADLFVHLVGVVSEVKLKRVRQEAERRAPDAPPAWLLDIVGQARATLAETDVPPALAGGLEREVEPEEGDEEK